MSTMTQARHPGHGKQSDRPAPRARLISGRLALALMSSFGALTSFYLLLSVTPMYAVSAGAGRPEARVVARLLGRGPTGARFGPGLLPGGDGYPPGVSARALPPRRPPL